MSQLLRAVAILALFTTMLPAQEPPRPPRAPRMPSPATPPLPALPPAEPKGLIFPEMQYLDDLSVAAVERAVQEGMVFARSAARAGLDIARAQLDGERTVLRAALSGLGTMESYATAAPAPWAQADPADSLYRAARKALSGDAYRKAAELFNQIWRRFPNSSYTPDAYYWQAFALQRIGGDQQLGEALAVLETQSQKFPKAATRGDAAALRSRMEGVLARRGDVLMATTLMGRAESATRDGCPRANEDERIDALNAVTQMDADRAMPILKKVLARREPCTQQLRRTAVWLVASRKQPEAAEILMTVAKSDPDKEVREQAVFWMANVPTEEATTMLIDLARKGDDLDLRKRAVYALSRSKSPRAAITIREIALDGNVAEDLRAEAMQWYLSGPGKESEDGMAFLKDMYERADGQRLKQRVLSQVASRRTESSREFLVSLATNNRESMELRRSAIAMLGGNGWSSLGSLTTVENARVSTARAGGGSSNATGASVVVAQLTTIYDKVAELELRQQVLSSLASMRDNAGVDKLIDVARTEKNLELRKSAVSHLSRIKDPRALALLQEIIDR